MTEISRFWRVDRSAGGMCGSGSKEKSTGVLVWRDSRLRMEDRTWLSWEERVWAEVVLLVADVENTMLIRPKERASCMTLRLAGCVRC